MKKFLYQLSYLILSVLFLNYAEAADLGDEKKTYPGAGIKHVQIDGVDFNYDPMTDSIETVLADIQACGPGSIRQIDFRKNFIGDAVAAAIVCELSKDKFSEIEYLCLRTNQIQGDIFDVDKFSDVATSFFGILKKPSFKYVDISGNHLTIDRVRALFDERKLTHVLVGMVGLGIVGGIGGKVAHAASGSKSYPGPSVAIGAGVGALAGALAALHLSDAEELFQKIIWLPEASWAEGQDQGIQKTHQQYYDTYFQQSL